VLHSFFDFSFRAEFIRPARLICGISRRGSFARIVTIWVIPAPIGVRNLLTVRMSPAIDEGNKGGLTASRRNAEETPKVTFWGEAAWRMFP
jgi:hypothetical protein